MIKHAIGFVVMCTVMFGLSYWYLPTLASPKDLPYLMLMFVFGSLYRSLLTGIFEDWSKDRESQEKDLTTVRLYSQAELDGWITLIKRKRGDAPKGAAK